MSDTTIPEPVVHSEKGYDQTDVPAEKANAAPDDETLEQAKQELDQDLTG